MNFLHDISFKRIGEITQQGGEKEEKHSNGDKLPCNKRYFGSQYHMKGVYHKEHHVLINVHGVATGIPNLENIPVRQRDML